MSKSLLIIPNLNEIISGASKRAINIARELSKYHFVQIISNKKIFEDDCTSNQDWLYSIGMMSKYLDG